MTKFKKIGCGCGVVALVLVVIIAVGVQIALKKGLKAGIDKVLPIGEEALGVDLEVAAASVDIVGFNFNFDGVKVGNPEGFAEEKLFFLDRCAADVAIMSLKSGLIEIPEVSFKGAEIYIIRNPKGEGEESGPLNIQVLADNLKSDEDPEAEEEEEEEEEEEAEEEEEEEEEGPKEPISLPAMRLGVLEISTLLTYIDHDNAGAGPMTLGLKNMIKLEEFSTAKAELGIPANLTITGSLASDEGLCVTDITGTIQPLDDPLKATFDIEGSIGKVDLKFARPYLAMAQVTRCDGLDLRIKLVCNEGVFDKKQSVIELELTNVGISGGVSMTPGQDYIPSLTIPIPIAGTLEAPTSDFGEGLKRALKDNISKNAGAAITGAIAKELGVPGLGGLFGGGKSDDDSGEASGKATDAIAKPDVSKAVPKPDVGKEMKKKIRLPF